MAAMDECHHPGAPQAGVDFIDTTHTQRLLHAGGGVVLLKTQLRVGVQVAAQRCQFRVKLGNVRKRTPAGLKTLCLHWKSPRSGGGHRPGRTKDALLYRQIIPPPACA